MQFIRLLYIGVKQQQQIIIQQQQQQQQIIMTNLSLSPGLDPGAST